MRSNSVRALVIVAALALAGMVSGAPASAAAAVQGVTGNTITMVIIVPDVDQLVKLGVIASSPSTTASFATKFSSMAKAAGTINGRTIDVKTVVWNPIDVTSFDKACIAATRDAKPFVVVNASGYQSSSVPCITVDNKTPMIYGDPVPNAFFKASGKNLITLAMPAEPDATAAAKFIVKNNTIPKTAKIGIFSNNVAAVKANASTLSAALTKAGYNVASTVELNGLAADSTLLNTQSAAGADTFKAAGVDTVINTQSFTQMSGFFSEATKIGLKYTMYGIDGQASACSTWGPQTSGNPGMANVNCITYYDVHQSPTKTAIKPDTAAEATCRTNYDASAGFKSLNGGSSSAVVVGSKTYNNDLPVNECQIAGFLFPAIKAAGKNLTWSKVYDNILGMTKLPGIYMANGTVGFGKNKPYAAVPTFHQMVAVANTRTAVADSNGLFQGCATPTNCWIPVVPGSGTEWTKL